MNQHEYGGGQNAVDAVKRCTHSWKMSCPFCWRLPKQHMLLRAAPPVNLYLWKSRREKQTLPTSLPWIKNTHLRTSLSVFALAVKIWQSNDSFLVIWLHLPTSLGHLRLSFHNSGVEHLLRNDSCLFCCQCSWGCSSCDFMMQLFLSESHSDKHTATDCLFFYIYMKHAVFHSSLTVDY